MRIQLSTEALCAEARCCLNVQAKRGEKRRWLADKIFYKGVNSKGEERIYTAVETMNCGYYMDCITGSLLDNAGNTLTGAKEVIQLTQDTVGGYETLLRKIPPRIQGETDYKNYNF